MFIHRIDKDSTVTRRGARAGHPNTSAGYIDSVSSGAALASTLMLMHLTTKAPSLCFSRLNIKLYICHVYCYRLMYLQKCLLNQGVFGDMVGQNTHIILPKVRGRSRTCSGPTGYHSRECCYRNREALQMGVVGQRGAAEANRADRVPCAPRCQAVSTYGELSTATARRVDALGSNNSSA
ncbi:hypothetical protein K461DRAFT_64431 [Myriangium duriaei CBS 260.36]|uniref:Uncharacterized protein n=1 Tax=Myriangium duriaei CBS 260.36 TaxID=1168546 RepID=A0A9P4IV63_9PEZI|nr:hypothetical protein K461DRAFT_64431 [Myriangium duriaei CBS 260.36]